MPDFEKQERQRAESADTVGQGEMILADAITTANLEQGALRSQTNSSAAKVSEVRQRPIQGTARLRGARRIIARFNAAVGQRTRLRSSPPLTSSRRWSPEAFLLAADRDRSGFLEIEFAAASGATRSLNPKASAFDAVRVWSSFSLLELPSALTSS